MKIYINNNSSKHNNSNNSNNNSSKHNNSNNSNSNSSNNRNKSNTILIIQPLTIIVIHEVSKQLRGLSVLRSSHDEPPGSAVRFAMLSPRCGNGKGLGVQRDLSLRPERVIREEKGDNLGLAIVDNSLGLAFRSAPLKRRAACVSCFS